MTRTLKETGPSDVRDTRRPSRIWSERSRKADRARRYPSLRVNDECAGHRGEPLGYAPSPGRLKTVLNTSAVRVACHARPAPVRFTILKREAELVRVEQLCNRFIRRNLRRHDRHGSAVKTGRLPLTKIHEEVRVVKMGDAACGGTHVRRTGTSACSRSHESATLPASGDEVSLCRKESCIQKWKRTQNRPS